MDVSAMSAQKKNRKVRGAFLAAHPELEHITDPNEYHNAYMRLYLKDKREKLRSSDPQKLKEFYRQKYEREKQSKLIAAGAVFTPLELKREIKKLMAIKLN